MLLSFHSKQNFQLSKKHAVLIFTIILAMLDQILSVLRNEDTFKFFTGNAHRTIYEAVSAISDPHELKELERVF